MLDSVLPAYAYNLNYLRKLVADLDDAKMTIQPAPKMNHAAWVLGHLAETCDFAGGLLGVKPGCPASWSPLFDHKSQPSADASLYPPKEELLQAVVDGHARVEAAIRAAKPADLAKPHSIEMIRKQFPTTADLLAFLMTTHEATHLGQLSAWRRVQGLPSV